MLANQKTHCQVIGGLVYNVHYVYLGVLDPYCLASLVVQVAVDKTITNYNNKQILYRN